MVGSSLDEVVYRKNSRFAPCETLLDKSWEVVKHLLHISHMYMLPCASIEVDARFT